MPTRLLLAAFVIASLGCGMSSDDHDFSWADQMDSGSVLHVRNMNGPIAVTASRDGQVHVKGTRRWKAGFPERVSFVVNREGADVTVCAVWGSRGRCDPNSYRSRPSMWDKLFRRSVSVDLVISVPQGLRLDAKTTNGDVDVRGMSSAVSATSVNGDVQVATTGGPVNASSVNGDVDAEMNSIVGTEPIELHTVNGDVTAHIPDQPDVNVDLSTVNGSLQTDFPMTIAGRANPRS
jgi:hypothetical protein